MAIPDIANPARITLWRVPPYGYGPASARIQLTINGTMSSSPIDALLAKLTSGDAVAAEQVFLAYEPYLRKIVRRRLPLKLRAKMIATGVVYRVAEPGVCNLVGQAAGFQPGDMSCVQEPANCQCHQLAEHP